MGSRDVHSVRHVLAVKDLATSAEYYVSRLGFEKELSVDGWVFLSFGAFKIMLGECPDDMSASETNNHSYFAHVLVEDADSVYAEFKKNGVEFSSHISDMPWGHREFCLLTPDGHRIVFAHEIESHAAHH